MDWHASLDQEVTSQVIEPAQVVNPCGSFHIVNSLDGAIDRVRLVQGVDLRIDQILRLVLARQW